MHGWLAGWLDVVFFENIASWIPPNERMNKGTRQVNDAISNDDGGGGAAAAAMNGCVQLLYKEPSGAVDGDVPRDSLRRGRKLRQVVVADGSRVRLLARNAVGCCFIRRLVRR